MGRQFLARICTTFTKGRALTALIITSLLAGCAGAPPVSNKMPIGKETRAPSGYVDFCERHPGECTFTATARTSAILNSERWSELNEVNFKYNSSIRPVTDQQLLNRREYWQYPDRAGDCEDYVLAKRRELIARGWQETDLLIATARNRRGELHALLVVSTLQGDFVLDNVTNQIHAWDAAPYRWVSRQSQQDPLVWQRAGRQAAATTLASLQ